MVIHTLKMVNYYILMVNSIFIMVTITLKMVIYDNYKKFNIILMVNNTYQFHNINRLDPN